MTAISRNAHRAKEDICNIMKDFLNCKIGERVVIELSDETLIFERIGEKK